MPVAPHIGKEFEAFLKSLVKSGRFASREDALRQGFKLMRAQEKRRQALDVALAAGRVNPRVKQAAMAELALKTRRDKLLQAMKAYRATSG